MTSSEPARVTLPTDEQILITREFEAPKAHVYQALTTPDLVRRWWAARRGEMTIADIDLRVGGTWRYAMVTSDGTGVAFHGVYREVVPAERLVYTEAREDRPGPQALVTVTLTEAAGRTTLAIRIEYGSRRDRDAHRDYMGAGLRDALDLLERTARAIGTAAAPARAAVRPGTASRREAR